MSWIFCQASLTSHHGRIKARSLKIKSRGDTIKCQSKILLGTKHTELFRYSLIRRLWNENCSALKWGQNTKWCGMHTLGEILWQKVVFVGMRQKLLPYIQPQSAQYLHSDILKTKRLSRCSSLMQLGQHRQNKRNLFCFLSRRTRGLGSLLTIFFWMQYLLVAGIALQRRMGISVILEKQVLSRR